MTKSSVNFKAVKSAGHAVSHASREVAPTYLLPSDKSIGTMVLLDDMGKVAATLEAKLALASRQALREKNYSPVWEGVLNLRRPKPGEDAKSYKADCSKVVTDWYKRYETSTGHKVLRVDVHLDEGHMVEGEAVLNAHAHVIADRTNDLGRVIQLSPKQLRELQTLTAEVTGLERGKSSFETGRKHIEHQAYKYLAEHGRLETQQQVTDLKVNHEKELEKPKADLVRLQKLSKEWSDADLTKVKNLQAQLDGEPTRLDAALAAQEEKYRLDRERMKQENADALAAGLAKMYSQEDYQDLKKSKDAEIAALQKDLKAALADLSASKAEAGKVPELKTKLAEAQQQAGKVPALVAKLDAEPARLKAALKAQEAQLKEQYRLDMEALEAGYKTDREKYKASAEKKTQQDYKDLKTAYLGELDVLAKAHAAELETLKRAHAEQVTGLEKDLKAALAEAKKVPDLESKIDRLTPVAAQVPDLKTKLAEAQQQAGKVPALVAGAVQAQVEINRLVPLAAQVPDLKKALTAAQEKAGEVPDLKEQITILKTKIEGEPGRQKAALNDLNVKALEVINSLRKQVKTLEAHPPAPSTRGGETAVVVPSGREPDSRPHGAVPHTPSDHASASDIQRLRQSLKTPPVPTPQVQPEAPKKPTLMELVKASIEGFMQWLKGRGLNEKLVEPPENGACFGPVVDIDNVHAFQKTGRVAYTHHRLDSLSHVPELNNPKTEIRYRGGLGEIHGQGPERPRQRGG